MALKRRKNRMPTPPCPLSECMAVLGAAWTPHVLWYLAGGPRRFSELRADIPLVSAKVLTQRLRELEARGVVARRVVASSPPSVEYELSALGRDFLPAIQAIVEVSYRLKTRREEAADGLAKIREEDGAARLNPRGGASPEHAGSPPAGQAG